MSSRIKRMAGRMLYLVAQLLPPTQGAISLGQRSLRRAAAKMILARCGKNVTIEKSARFDSIVELGNNSGIGERCIITNKVIIGDNVMMAREVLINPGNHVTTDTEIPMCQQGFEPKKPVIIEDDVWLGSRCMIMPGITIHKGSVVAAEAVVTRDVPEYAIVGGVPARVIRYRKQPENN